MTPVTLWLQHMAVDCLHTEGQQPCRGRTPHHHLTCCLLVRAERGALAKLLLWTASFTHSSALLRAGADSIILQTTSMLAG